VRWAQWPTPDRGGASPLCYPSDVTAAMIDSYRQGHGVSINLTGLHKASTSAWILVVSPPRDRPIACSPFFRAPALC
jgi:hypothetical protein